ncbi:hypothetical protein HK102_005350, partial [Quaeritorhiza haematococci]
MVIVHVKRKDESLLLHNAPGSTKIRDLLATIVRLHNFRVRLKKLIDAVEDLIEYGPMKPESEHGYSEEQLEVMAKEGKANSAAEGKTDKIKERALKNGLEVLLNPDPTGRRCGEAPIEESADIIRKTLTNARTLLGPEQIAAGKFLELDALREALANIRGAITIVYPMGLPSWDPVQELLSIGEGDVVDVEMLDPKDATIWWASKELLPVKSLSDYVGKNEKTKIIAKLQKKGQGAPVREAPLDEKAQKALMAHWYRKQEENK